MAFNAKSTKISSMLSPLSNPSIAFFDTLITIIIRGMIIGKLNIAISIPLFPAFEAILDTMVRVEENPTAPNRTTTKKKS